MKRHIAIVEISKGDDEIDGEIENDDHEVTR